MQKVRPLTSCLAAGPEQDVKDPADRCRGKKKNEKKTLLLFLSASGGLLSCVHTKLDSSLFAQKAASCKFTSEQSTGADWRGGIFCTCTRINRRKRVFCICSLFLSRECQDVYDGRRQRRASERASRSGEASQTSAGARRIIKTNKQTNKKITGGGHFRFNQLG